MNKTSPTFSSSLNDCLPVPFLIETCASGPSAHARRYFKMTNAPPIVFPETKDSFKNGSRTTMIEAGKLDITDSKLPFPWKLHKLLEDAETRGITHVVSWLPGGEAFKVHNPAEFYQKIMTQYFKQTRYKSFTRQVSNRIIVTRPHRKEEYSIFGPQPPFSYCSSTYTASRRSLWVPIKVHSFFRAFEETIKKPAWR
jgi:hypothetical protein